MVLFILEIKNFCYCKLFFAIFFCKNRVVQKWTKMDKVDNCYPFWIILDNILDNAKFLFFFLKKIKAFIVTKKGCSKWTFFGHF